MPTHSPNLEPTPRDRFLVCGLGKLGQACVSQLAQFGVHVTGVDLQYPSGWVTNPLPTEQVVLGDCRQRQVLIQAGIQTARTILLVTSDERINLEAALVARLLNPRIRLVLRSAKENLNHLLSQRLGNFAAFEATQLSATAFALPALDNETLGLFNLGDTLVRVVKRQLTATDPWCDRPLKQLDIPRKRRLLSVTLERLNPEPVPVGSALIYMEVLEKNQLRTRPSPSRWPLFNQQRLPLDQQFQQFRTWIRQDATRSIVAASLLIITVLLVTGTVLQGLLYPNRDWVEDFFATITVLVDGFGNPLVPNPPWWLRLFSLGLALAGTVLIGILYALVTQKLLSAQFQLLSRRPPAPTKDHVVVVGLGRVGQQVAKLLQELGQSLVAVNSEPLGAEQLPQVPIVVGNILSALAKVQLANARSVIMVTDDDMLNLEVALTAHTANPTSSLVLRTLDLNLTGTLAQLLPYARVLCAYALAAEAFSAAAFGEDILGLFRLGEQTILVVEFSIEPGDQLNGLFLSELLDGYQVVPVLHQKNKQAPALLPAEEIKIETGDRVVVLATLESLRRIEVRAISPRRWRVAIKQARTKDSVFDGINVLVRLTGLKMGTARSLMEQLPQPLPMPLYQAQANQLVQELAGVLVMAEAMEHTP